MMKKKIVILHYSYGTQLIPSLVKDCQSNLMNEIELECISIEDIDKDGIVPFIQSIVAKEDTIDGVVGMNDSPALISAIITDKLNLPGPTLLSIVHTQNKYSSRRLQRESVPNHTPQFMLGSQFLAGTNFASSFPVILKPIRSNFSVNTYVAKSAQQLQQLVPSSMAAIKGANAQYCKLLTEVGISESSAYEALDDVLIEGYVSGEQYTIDGYIYQGKVGFLGVTLSEFLPNTLSFSRFTFPCFFTPEIENKIHNGIEKCLLEAGFDNMMFNVEFRLNKDTGEMFIIEINTRIAAQFIHLISKVTGQSPFEYMVHIALGEDPQQITSSSSNNYNLASSCVLRLQEDALVTRVPTPEDIAAVYAKYPDVVIINFAPLGQKLSDIEQDTYTFRYAWVNIPGSSRDDIEQKLADIKPMLGYEFEPLARI